MEPSAPEAVQDALHVASLDPTRWSEALSVLARFAAGDDARLATAIASGNTPDEAAALLRMTVGTARTHLKRVFYKTATTRQAELVRLVLGEIPPTLEP